MTPDRHRRRFVRTDPPIDRLLTPFREFSQGAASSGILLVVAALVALVWANSPAAPTYEQLFRAPLTLGWADVTYTASVHFVINDGLMAVFFLLVGLEIKRELLVGELASRRQALLPVVAAAGGAVLPALIFLAVAGGTPESRPGWGVPMATDIAFALGVLALLGSRVPLGLRVFLAALAIVDDLLAVVVIAVFYTSELGVGGLAAAALIVGALVVANALGVRSPVVYGLFGVLLWAAVLQSGIHPTIAGVLLAAAIPARRRVDTRDFVDRARALVDHVAGSEPGASSPEDGDAALWDLEDLTEQAQAPMLRIEHALQPWVAFAIVPLFALANAGVAVPSDLADLVAQPIVVGIVVGLVLGKLVGITGTTWLVVRVGLASLPAGVTWGHVVGVALLGGIGFTMSLFIAELAYGASPALTLAKVGILGASVIAATGGLTVLVTAARTAPVPLAADEAPGPG